MKMSGEVFLRRSNHYSKQIFSIQKIQTVFEDMPMLDDNPLYYEEER